MSQDLSLENYWFLHNPGSPYTRLNPEGDKVTVRPKLGFDLGIPKKKIEFKKLVKIAYLDYGADLDHPFLKRQLDQEFLEAIYNKSWSLLKAELKETHGHGTEVAGVMAAVLRYLELYNDRPKKFIKIVPIRAIELDRDELGPRDFYGNLRESIRRAIDFQVDVLSISAGINPNPDIAARKTLEDEIKRAIDSGITIFAAAANDRSRKISSPCDFPGVICVGSSQDDGYRALGFSNFGSSVDLSAPGKNIYTTTSGKGDYFNLEPEGFSFVDGTSFSTPMVAMVYGVLRSVFPEETPRASLARLLQSTEQIKNDSPESPSLFGQVNLTEATLIKSPAVVYPQVKSASLDLDESIVLGKDTYRARRAFVFKCFGGACGSVSAEVKVFQNDVLVGRDFTKEVLKESEDLEVPVEIDLDLNGPRDLQVKIDWSFGGQKRHSQFRLPVRLRPKLETISLPFPSRLLTLGKPILEESKASSESGSPCFWYQNEVQSRLRVAVYCERQSGFIELDVQGLTKVDHIFLIDIDDNQSKEVVVLGQNKKFFGVKFFSASFKTLPHLPDLIVLNMPKAINLENLVSLKWAPFDFRGRKIKLPVILSPFYIVQNEPLAGRLPKAFSKTVNSKNFFKQILGFTADSAGNLKIKVLSDLVFWKNAYKLMDLEPEDEMDIVAPLNDKFEDLNFLVFVKKKNQEGRNYVLSFSEKNSKFGFLGLAHAISDSKAISVESTANSWQIILKPISRNNYLITCISQEKFFQFEIKSQKPLTKVFGLSSFRDGWQFLAGTDLGLESWYVDSKTFVASLRHVYSWDFPFDLKNEAYIKLQIPIYERGLTSIVSHDGFWLGGEVFSIQPLGLDLFGPIRRSFAVEPGCFVFAVTTDGESQPNRGMTSKRLFMTCKHLSSEVFKIPF